MSLDRERLLADIEGILGPDGVLEQRLDGFAFREGQLGMARFLANTLCDGLPAMVEGGTGIGKTLAYLIPTLLSGHKTVVSTGTKTLQEQIFFKDVPMLLDAVDLPVKVTYMKGRSNYLCKLRFGQFAAQRMFRFASDGNYFDAIEQWAAVTETGDRAELSDMPDDYSAWQDLTSTSDNCLGSRCRHFDSCYITRMRRRAQEADLIIVNHYLYFADLAVRENEFGEVIPDHDIVVMDEAHLMESVATQYFGLRVSNRLFFSLVDDIGRWKASTKLIDGTLDAFIEELRMDVARFFEPLAQFGTRYRFDSEMIDPALEDAYADLDNRLDIMARHLDGLPEKEEDAKGFAHRLRNLANNTAAVFGERSPEWVYWGETNGRTIALNASPLDVAPLMEKRFFSRNVLPLFASATLATGDSFSYFRERVGLPPESVEGVFPSPFDYRHQTLLYVPRRLPEPMSANFRVKAAAEIERLITLSRGAALVLFTSYANMNDIHARLAGRFDFPLLKQGDAPRNLLLEQFRESVDSVLFATGTFWQGVDVLGESLRLVVIDKLPFEPPGEPINEARIAAMRNTQRDPFNRYQVPNAIIQLKQGVGRLIRDAGDWGVIALLDRRVVTKGYGKRFLKSLPPSVRVDRFDHVKSWWRRKEGMAGLDVPLEGKPDRR